MPQLRSHARSALPASGLWSVPLLAVLLLSVAACGGGSGTDPMPPAPPPGPSSFIAADPGPGFDYALGMDSFADGSTVVCGWFPGMHTWEAGRPDETTRIALGANDGYIARYDPDGNLEWVQLIMGTDFVEVDEVAALPDGSCVVMGSTRDLAIFAPAEPEQQDVDLGAASFVARYLASGTLAWVRIIEGHEVDVRDKCVFADSSVGFCGRINASAIFGDGESGETDLTGMTSEVLTDFVARYSSSGDLVYAVAPSDATGLTQTTGVTALADGSAIAVGYFGGTATLGAGTAAVKTFTATDFDDGYVVGLSPTGTLQWARQLGGPGRQLPVTATTLPGGTVAFIGSFTEGTMTFNEGEASAVTITGSAFGNTWLCRYDASGAPVWSTHVEHADGAFLNLAGVVAYSDNAIAFIGAGPGSVTVDPGGPDEAALPAFDSSDLFLARYDASGSLLWARRDGGAGGIARAEGVAAYADGSLGFAGGYFLEFTVDQGGPGETTYAGADATDTLLIRYNADGSHDGR